MSDVSLGLAHEVEVMLRKVGATRENFWKPISEDHDLAQRVLELVNTRPPYGLVIDYNRSLIQMIEPGSYDWVNDSITEKNFPIEGIGRHKIEVTLFHFNRIMTSKQVIAEMDKQGYRPAKIEELLALGENQPDLRRQFPIIGLFSVWQGPDGDRYVPELCGSVSERGLNLSWFGNDWDPYYHFVGVRK